MRSDPHPDRSLALLTADGVRLDAAHDRSEQGGLDLAIVLAHGFTGSWRKPAVREIATRLRRVAGVVSFDFRGHGRSSGVSTMGDREVLDVAAAVEWARVLGYRAVATVGWSMGGTVVVRHAALHPGKVDAVVSVSAPSRWFYRGTAPMRRVHLAVEHPIGRLVSRRLLRTRISGDGWAQLPEEPQQVAGRISPTPLLVVHGDQDGYLPVDHAERLFAAAAEPRELWLLPGFGHAEAAADADLVDRIGEWVRGAVPAVSG